MDQDHIRLFPLQHRGELLQNRLSDVKERLPLLHNRQVIIRLHTEGAHHLLQHGFMLPGGADHGSKLRPAFQLVDQGAHFDGFGSGTKYQEYLLAHFVPPLYSLIFESNLLQMTIMVLPFSSRMAAVSTAARG